MTLYSSGFSPGTQSGYSLLATGANPPVMGPNFPITSFTVGPVGQAQYQTIQAAMDAADFVEAGVIYVQFGTYTENLVFKPNIVLCGVQSPTVSQIIFNGGFVTIVGTHTPALSAGVQVQNIFFDGNGGDIFFSTSVNLAYMSFYNCTFNNVDGYTLNVANCTSIFEMFNCQSSSSDDGLITCNGSIYLFNCNVGVIGESAGTPIIANVIVGHSCIINSIINVTVGFDLEYCYISRDMVVPSGCSGIGLFCEFDGQITYNSAINSAFRSCIFTAANPVMTGTGAGTILLNAPAFSQGNVIDPALTVQYEGVISCNRSGANAVAGIATLVAGSIQVNTTAVTANSIIIVTLNTPGGTQGFLEASSGDISPGANFFITSSSLSDTSTVNWMIIQ